MLIELFVAATVKLPRLLIRDTAKSYSCSLKQF
jgi:hypothetical protein